MASTGDRIRLLRENAKMTQRELAKLLGVVNSTISLYEHGKSTPNDQIKIAICKHFGVSLDYLLGVSDKLNANSADADEQELDCSPHGEERNSLNRLRSMREARGMTQKELGDLLNLQSSVISKYERGAVSLSGDLIQQLCEIFDCSADYLLGISNTPSCKKCPLTVGQGDRIVQSALRGTGLLSEDGSLAPGSEEVISDFLSRNADILKQLVRDEK